MGYPPYAKTMSLVQKTHRMCILAARHIVFFALHSLPYFHECDQYELCIGQGGGAVSLEDVAVVEVAALVDVTVARGMTGIEFLKGRHILEFRDRLGRQGRAGRLVGTEKPARTPTF
jgi:hypothetical protein